MLYVSFRSAFLSCVLGLILIYPNGKRTLTWYSHCGVEYHRKCLDEPIMVGPKPCSPSLAFKMKSWAQYQQKMHWLRRLRPHICIQDTCRHLSIRSLQLAEWLKMPNSSEFKLGKRTKGPRNASILNIANKYKATGNWANAGWKFIWLEC